MLPSLNVIGEIRTPYSSLKECPKNIQFEGPMCELVISEKYIDEIRGLHEGELILILYWLSNHGFPMPADNKSPGVFALRTPIRPNPIGVAVVPIEKINGRVLFVKGLDCLDKTNLIDIKPAIYNENRFNEI